MEVDYKVYGDGEARLGWLNCTAPLTAKQAFDGNSFLRRAGERGRSAATARRGVADE